MSRDLNAVPDLTQASTQTDQGLDTVLKHLSRTLSELHADCLELQKLDTDAVDTGSDAQIIKAQAMDKVTQYLDCLSEFSGALANRSQLRAVKLDDQDYAVIKLDSVKQALMTGSPQTPTSASGDIDLF